MGAYDLIGFHSTSEDLRGINYESLCEKKYECKVNQIKNSEFDKYVCIFFFINFCENLVIGDPKEIILILKVLIKVDYGK